MKHLTLLLVIFSLCLQVNLFASSNDIVLNIEEDTVERVEVITTSFLEIIENNIVITWENISIKEYKGFEIERSKDRKNWTRIGFVSFKKGTKNYKFTDSTNLPTSNYYRVKEVSFSDLPENDKIITELEVVVEGESFSMSSNPVGNYLMVNNSQGLLTIYNSDGELVKQVRVTEESIAVDTSDLVKGQYILKVQKEDYNTISRLIVKN